MTSPIEVRGLSELITRMRAYPQQLSASLKATMDAAMLTVHENVPPYPAPPSDSTYVRTGTLGRTLGSGVGGGKSGAPDIYEVRPMGSGFEGHFGTNLDYAPHVIGDDTQAWMHYRWWQMRTVADKAKVKIDRLFGMLAEKLAKFLEGRG
jgi:hypothetical protein